MLRRVRRHESPQPPPRCARARRRDHDRGLRRRVRLGLFDRPGVLRAGGAVAARRRRRPVPGRPARRSGVLHRPPADRDREGQAPGGRLLLRPPPEPGAAGAPLERRQGRRGPRDRTSRAEPVALLGHGGARGRRSGVEQAHRLAEPTRRDPRPSFAAAGRRRGLRAATDRAGGPGAADDRRLGRRHDHRRGRPVRHRPRGQTTSLAADPVGGRHERPREGDAGDSAGHHRLRARAVHRRTTARRTAAPTSGVPCPRSRG